MESDLLRRRECRHPGARAEPRPCGAEPAPWVRPELAALALQAPAQGSDSSQAALSPRVALRVSPGEAAVHGSLFPTCGVCPAIRWLVSPLVPEQPSPYPSCPPSWNMNEREIRCPNTPGQAADPTESSCTPKQS